MEINEFINSLNNLGIKVTDHELNLLEKYFNFLNEYNKHTNITRIVDKKDVYLKHFYDSLTVVKEVSFSNNDKVLDIGSGAGFPGIVLKIFFPNIKLTVLDSNNKKTKFLNELVSLLELKNVEIVNDRAENFSLKHLNEFDYVFSRAVSYIDIIISLSIPFIKETGKVVLMKGNIDNEIKVLELHKDNLNVKNYKVNNFNLYNNIDERNLVIITKDKKTTKVLGYSQILNNNKKWRID